MNFTYFMAGHECDKGEGGWKSTQGGDTEERRRVHKFKTYPGFFLNSLWAQFYTPILLTMYFYKLHSRFTHNICPIDLSHFFG